jgi:uncharacterized protein
MMDKKKFPEIVKNSILQIEPNADVILYGSRAREDNSEESDWDFLICVDGEVDPQRVDKIRRRIYDVEWETGQVLCSIVRAKSDWNSEQYKAMPFYKNVAKEGIFI